MSREPRDSFNLFKAAFNSASFKLSPQMFSATISRKSDPPAISFAIPAASFRTSQEAFIETVNIFLSIVVIAFATNFSSASSAASMIIVFISPKNGLTLIFLTTGSVIA